jgi:hypothetical protein
LGSVSLQFPDRLELKDKNVQGNLSFSGPVQVRCAPNLFPAKICSTTGGAIYKVEFMATPCETCKPPSFFEILRATVAVHAKKKSAAFLAEMVIVCGLLAGCVAAPPVSHQVSSDPLLERQGGVLLLVDAAVQINVMGHGDYFVINEAKAGGQATLSSLRKYIEDSNKRDPV